MDNDEWEEDPYSAQDLGDCFKLVGRGRVFGWVDEFVEIDGVYYALIYCGDGDDWWKIVACHIETLIPPLPYFLPTEIFSEAAFWALSRRDRSRVKRALGRLFRARTRA